MHKTKHLLAMIACGAIGLAPWQSIALADGQAASAEAESTIFERQNIMTQLQEDSETLGNIAAGIESKDKLAAVTLAVAKGAHESVEAFRNQVPGGRSKPEVWSNNADFMKRMTDFATSADELAELGKTGNLNGVTDKLGAALPCRECHQLYRAPKKPA